jgi:hypothetical protein
VGPQTAMNFIGDTFQHPHSWRLPSRDVLMSRSHVEFRCHTIDWYFRVLSPTHDQFNLTPELFKSSGRRHINMVKKPVVGRLPVGRSRPPYSHQCQMDLVAPRHVTRRVGNGGGCGGMETRCVGDRQPTAVVWKWSCKSTLKKVEECTVSSFPSQRVFILSDHTNRCVSPLGTVVGRPRSGVTPLLLRHRVNRMIIFTRKCRRGSLILRGNE